MSMHVLYKISHKFIFFKINDFGSYFDFINNFGFKSFGLILIWKFKFFIKTKVTGLYMKNVFAVYGEGYKIMFFYK